MRPKKKKYLLGIMLALAMVVGVLVGSGLAYASDVGHDLSSGYNGYTSYHSDNYAGYNIHDDYYNYEYIYRSADSTSVEIYNIHKYSGHVTPTAAQPNVVFGYAWYYDEYGHHSVMDYYFASVEIQGCNNYSYPYWTYSSFDQNDNYLICEQNIWYGDPGSGYTSLGVDFDTYYTGIGSR